MNLCSDGHQEVCFEGRECPVCLGMGTISDMEDKIYDLKEEISNLKENDA